MKRSLPLLLGALVLGAAWAGPLPALAGKSFAAHMLMHMAVVAVASPLLALGLRRQLPGLTPTGPMLASLLDLVVVWAWHMPMLHEWARGGGGAMVLEQASFLVVGLLLWISALAPPAENPGGSALAGSAALFFTSMHMTLLGVLLALAPLPLFHAGHGMPPFDLSPATDRELGGILMLGIGGTVYLVGGLVLVAGILRLPDRRR